MNIKIVFISFFLLSYVPSILSGEYNLKPVSLSLKNSEKISAYNKYFTLSKNTSKAGINAFMYTALIINPMLVIEDKKAFFGLTKEISVGRFPYGRIAFEYSYIFRSYNNSHFRVSYNYDVILEAGDFLAILATPGAGYFTDTKNNGWFLHGSIGALIASSDYFALNPYLRYRHTFIKDKIKSDINDISLGVGLVFYY